MSYICYLCLFTYSGDQDILCFCFSSSMLPVSLDCQFLIATSVFSNVYSNHSPGCEDTMKY